MLFEVGVLLGDLLEDALLLDVDPHIRTVCRSNGSEGDCSDFRATAGPPLCLLL